MLNIPDVTKGTRPPFLDSGAAGNLSLRLLDASGQPIFTCRSQLSKMYWQWRRGELFGVIHDPLAPRNETSTLLPENFDQPSHLPSMLEVSYSPDANPPDVMAVLRVAAGATK